MSKKARRKAKKQAKRVRANAVAMFDDSYAILRSAGKPKKMWKLVRRAIKKRPALSAAGALATAVVALFRSENAREQLSSAMNKLRHLRPHHAHHAHHESGEQRSAFA